MAFEMGVPMPSMIVRSAVMDLAEFMPVVAGDGLHDLWGLYRDGSRLREIAGMLADPFLGSVDAVVGAEARGFLLGGVVAMEMALPFIPVRKQRGYLPGETTSRTSRPDWEGKRNVFTIQRHALEVGCHVLIVDDWFTTGNQARTVVDLVADVGAEVSGIAILVEEGLGALSDLRPVLHSLLHWCPRDEAFSVSECNRLQSSGVGDPRR